MRRIVLVFLLGAVTAGGCAAFSAESTTKPAVDAQAPLPAPDAAEAAETGVPDDAEDARDSGAEIDSGLARMTWNFDTSTNLGDGFSYLNESGMNERVRDVTPDCPSQPACFRSVVRPDPVQSAGRWGFRPYPDAGAKEGRYRIAFDVYVDCAHSDLTARTGMIELYCADAPTHAVASLSVGGTTGSSSGPLRVTARYKRAPDAGASDIYSADTFIVHKSWVPLVLDVTFGARGALSFTLDGDTRPEITAFPDGKGLGCPGSSVALQVGAVETFGGATGRCTIRYDNIVFEYPRP